MVEVGDVRLHVVDAGAGRPVILLHGFPDFWYAWRYQIPALAEAGCHVIAPDLRGYNRSSKPARVSRYRLDALVSDVHAIARHFGYAGAKDVMLVGHDCGAVVAWHVAMSRPSWLQRLAILNTPHPVAFLRGLSTLRQLRRSWYILYFQLPWLPEVLVGWGRAATLVKILRRDPQRADAFSPEDLEDYVQAQLQPGALTGALNIYRAAFRGGARRFAGPPMPIDVPTLVLWGDADRYLESSLATPPAERVSRCTVRHFPGASHWLMADRPDEVNRSLIEHLREA
jgi:pimeloyl-ACP methyl ester carboxylesterase